eukprot:15346560-Ditylum_brightwellii.AAC.1
MGHHLAVHIDEGDNFDNVPVKISLNLHTDVSTNFAHIIVILDLNAGKAMLIDLDCFFAKALPGLSRAES